MSNRLWDLSLSTGVGVIDIQNRRIVDYLNLLDSVQEGRAAGQVSLVLAGLNEFIERHFPYEERLMDRAGYPLTLWHAAAHERFKVMVKAYQVQHDAGENIVQSLYADLEVWLVEHIQQEDLYYAPYVKVMLNEVWFARLFNR
jgi:hemerythrin-like metal-binding protein